MTREDRIKTAISKGYTCNPMTGDIFGIKGNIIKDIDIHGYIIISIYDNKKRYRIKGHQFIWWFVNKEIVECIDHINGDRKDNRIENLRSITRQKNQWNIKNTKGYCFDKYSNKFKSSIKVNSKSIHIGNFDTEDEAKQAYLNAKKIYHTI